MILGIDGSNVRSGGSITYFRKMLAHASPAKVGIERVRVWANRATLDLLPERSWLEPIHVPVLERSQIFRLRWQRSELPALARSGCHLLFVPGGLVTGDFHPYVTMSRNMLPFEYREMARYGVSRMLLRLLMLRWGQGRSIRRADGIIFLTEYARNIVSRQANPQGMVSVVPHGVSDTFHAEPRVQEPITAFSEERPFRVLYISILDMYKHQWHLAEAVAKLRRAGLPISLELIGSAYPEAKKRLRKTLDRLDPESRFLHYLGPVPFEELPRIHRRANLFAFASSCENMPNILVEAMAAAHPIACSRRGPMPEILGDAGIYFDPERPEEIEAALRRLIENTDLRAHLAAAATRRASQYTWQRCAAETLDFIARVARDRGIVGTRPADTDHYATDLTFDSA